MKYPSVHAMYQHIMATHVDRVHSPKSYIDHFARLSNYGKQLQSSNYHQSGGGVQLLDRPSRNSSAERSIKIEQFTANHETPPAISPSRTPISATLIKQEQEQDSPTDLSKKSSATTDDDDDAGDEVNDKKSCESPRPIVTHPSSSVLAASAAANSPSIAVVGSFLCNQCNAALPDFESFRNHLKNHLSQASAVASPHHHPPNQSHHHHHHQQQHHHHQHLPVNHHVCPHCGQSLPNATEYDRHILGHFLIASTEFICECCGKSFAKSDELQKHLFDVHAQPMYKCSLCTDLFDSKVSIQVHFAVAHGNEQKVWRCSACMEAFKTDTEFKVHVKTRHAAVPVSAAAAAPAPSSGSVQCIFCRAVCSSDLEMHFHMAAHARQYRCPACSETFHVEFLLDRHMQTHHSAGATPIPIKDSSYPYKTTGAVGAISNHNNNILDYHYAAAAVASNNAAKYAFNNGKFYSSLDPSKSQHLYGFYDALSKGRYDTAGRTDKGLMGMYSSELASKLYSAEVSAAAEQRDAYHSTINVTAKATGLFNGNNVASNPTSRQTNKVGQPQPAQPSSEANKSNYAATSTDVADARFECGICEKTDFSSETEMHTHRKVVHNLKTGVSLRCAYCNGNFRSR